MKRKKTPPAAPDFAKLIDSFGHAHRPFKVFSDFCTLSTAAISNSMREFQPSADVERREKQYLDTAGRYSKDELGRFADMLGAVVLALEKNPRQDFLGEQYMAMDFGNDRTGQFFTPYTISSLMAQMLIADAPAELETKRYITINDPACGGGCMLIASYHAALDAGINPQTQCLFFGTDIDATSTKMAYIQCSLLGMCGHFFHGNSLSAEVWNSYSTPLFYMNSWRFGRQEIEPSADMIVDVPTPTPAVVEPVVEIFAPPPPVAGIYQKPQQLRLF